LFGAGPAIAVASVLPKAEVTKEAAPAFTHEFTDHTVAIDTMTCFSCVPFTRYAKWDEGLPIYRDPPIVVKAPK